MSDFIHLHNHSEYSLLDGACRIDEMIQKAFDFGMPALAITDHGNMFAAVQFYMKAIDAGIKPIIGQECYIAPEDMYVKKTYDSMPAGGYHLILLAKNIEGYRNLLEISSAGYLEGFYYRPRIDKKYLAEHSEGLIALSGCLKGEIPYLIVREQYEQAKTVLREYLDIFGTEDFYLEYQNHGLQEQKTAIIGLHRLATEMGVKTVATNDVHYLNFGDDKIHDILLCIQTGKTLEDEKRMKFNSDQFYFKSPDEMIALFKEYPESIENTMEIMNKCDVTLRLKQPWLPKYPLPDEYTEVNAFLREKAHAGLKEKYPKVTKKLEDRLDYELSVIEEMDYASYFAIVADFTDRARKLGIRVGPGRGSATGSLVSYSLGITDIDPIKYNLLFERFLNPERKNLPDIDIDFSDQRRGEIIDYVKDRYGEYSVTQIITFGTMAARAAIKDVGRVLNQPYSFTDRIAKLIPSVVGITLEQAIQNTPELNEMVKNDEAVEQIINFAKRIEGLPRHASVHAAGVVITPGKLTRYVPLFKTNKDEITTQFDGDTLESIGLLKMDFLGLKTLTIIDNTIDLVEKHKGEKIDIDNIDLKDKKTFQLLSRGDTLGIFQFESEGMKRYLKKLRPDSVDDMIVLNALYRPGPMKMIDEYISRKHGKKGVSYPHPDLEEVLKETFGIFIYQEQVMLAAQKLAGFSLGEADLLRRAMGKKKPKLMMKMRKIFMEGAKKRKIPKEQAKSVYDLMRDFCGYGFNKSHSAAYALLAYQTAYLKSHYPVAFLTANLTSEITNRPEKIYNLIEECQTLGIEVLPPDINKSSDDFTIENGNIRFGLAAIKNLGYTAIHSILESRKQLSKFSNIFEFCENVDLRLVNKKALENLIASGAMDSLNGTRAQLTEAIQDAQDWGSRKQNLDNSNQVSLFGEDVDLGRIMYPELPEVEPWPLNEMLAREKAAVGFYLSGHPLGRYEDEMKAFTNNTTATLNELRGGTIVRIGGTITQVKTITTRKGKAMAFATIEDPKGSVELIIFPDEPYNKFQMFLYKDSMVLMKGEVSYKNSEVAKVIVKEMVPLEEVRDLFCNFLDIRIHIDSVSENDMKLIIKLLKTNKGTKKLRIHAVMPEKTYVGISSEYSSNASWELVRELREILEKENVWIS
ncbi:DNA polymerase III subunit alpha [bacterium]|nr:DNA polymerase III subunit alpha [bacterium]